MSTDVIRFNNSMVFLHNLWKGPLEMAVFSYFLYREIGYYGFIGMGFILCFVPIQSKRTCHDISICAIPNLIVLIFHYTVCMGKMTAACRLQTARRTDRRVRIMNEIIQGIQIIKMYAWETSFAKVVDRIRK